MSGEKKSISKGSFLEGKEEGKYLFTGNEEIFYKSGNIKYKLKIQNNKIINGYIFKDSLGDSGRVMVFKDYMILLLKTR